MRLEELVSVYSEVEVGLSVFSEGLWDSVCVFFSRSQGVVKLVH